MNSDAKKIRLYIIIAIVVIVLSVCAHCIALYAFGIYSPREAIVIAEQIQRGIEFDQALAKTGSIEATDLTSSTATAEVPEIAGSANSINETTAQEIFAAKTAYQTMSSKEKANYEQLYKAAYLHKDGVDVSGFHPDDTADLFIEMFYDSPELFYVNPEIIYSGYVYPALFEGYSSLIEISYFYPEESIPEMTREIEQATAEALTELDNELGSEATDREKALFIHDWICKRAYYVHNGDDGHNLYDALVKGRAVCEGYAKAFAYLCRKAGLECEMIVGLHPLIDEPDLAHAWNRVLIDGEWLYVDATFDDGRWISHKHCLVDKSVFDSEGYDPYENNVPVYAEESLE